MGEGQADDQRKDDQRVMSASWGGGKRLGEVSNGTNGVRNAEKGKGKEKVAGNLVGVTSAAELPYRVFMTDSGGTVTKGLITGVSIPCTESHH